MQFTCIYSQHGSSEGIVEYIDEMLEGTATYTIHVHMYDDVVIVTTVSIQDKGAMDVVRKYILQKVSKPDPNLVPRLLHRHNHTVLKSFSWIGSQK